MIIQQTWSKQALDLSFNESLLNGKMMGRSLGIIMEPIPFAEIEEGVVPSLQILEPSISYTLPFLRSTARPYVRLMSEQQLEASRAAYFEGLRNLELPMI